jgi:hypothetical protein
MDHTFVTSTLELRQDIFIWRVQEIKEMHHRARLDCH